MDRDEAVRRALLSTFQLSDERLRALAAERFVQALEQDGYTVVTAPAAVPRLAELTEAWHKVYCVKEFAPQYANHEPGSNVPYDWPCYTEPPRLLALLPARTATTEAEDGIYIGPIQHMESQTVECWCRHCVWWKARYQADARTATTEAEALAAALDRLPDDGTVITIARRDTEWRVAAYPGPARPIQSADLPTAIAAALAATGGEE